MNNNEFYMHIKDFFLCCGNKNKRIKQTAAVCIKLDFDKIVETHSKQFFLLRTKIRVFLISGIGSIDERNSLKLLEKRIELE